MCDVTSCSLSHHTWNHNISILSPASWGQNSHIVCSRVYEYFFHGTHDQKYPEGGVVRLPNFEKYT